jgi:RNA polymerase sigma-70 factor, ECF subfamily
MLCLNCNISAYFTSYTMKSLKSNLKEKIAFLKLKSGDPEAFSFFYDRYVKQIYRFIIIKVSDNQVAEDLTQDVFLKTWQHLVDQKNVSHFRAFVYRVARNVVNDYYRQSDRRAIPLEYVADENLVSEYLEKLEVTLDAENLLRYLHKLKAEYQEILILRYVEDLSFEEIAEVLRKDKNNIRVTLHRALNKLKKIISEDIENIKE